MAQVQLGYFTLDTVDINRAKAFYGALFGWAFDAEASKSTYAHVAGSNPPFGFTKVEKPGNHSHLYFRVDDIQAMCDRAVGLGHVAACTDLAYLLYNGLGGEQDRGRALALYEQAARRGDVLAQANTGLMYASGTGTDTDRARAYAWYSLAASRGNAVAAVNRNRLMSDMSWEELNRAQAVAVDLYRQAENLPRPPAEPVGTPAAPAP